MSESIMVATYIRDVCYDYSAFEQRGLSEMRSKIVRVQIIIRLELQLTQ